MKILLLVLAVIGSVNTLMAQNKLIREGHRGCRGLMPENTIEAMKKALDLGVDVLELDVVISRDKQVIVSHDQHLTAGITTKPSGDTLTKEEEKKYILYSMPYAEIKKYDVGKKRHWQFPEQENFPAHIPLLSELIEAVDEYAKQKNLPAPNYNIEIKSQPKTDNVGHPQPKEFVELVMKVCKEKNIISRMNIQSFDARPLQIIHQQYPEVVLAYLTANPKTIAENLQFLGFEPQLYSPYYKTVNRELVIFCHEKGIKIIPWTVNTKEEINWLIQLGVDGIITDYPNYFP